MKEFWKFARDFFEMDHHLPDVRASFGPPDFLGDPCRKCGSRASGTKYDAALDVLELICHTCGFRWIKPPLDRKPVNG